MVVVINGRARAGKDSFVQCCEKIWEHRIFNVSTVDFVKNIARQCGWNGVKDLKSRKFLSDLKDLLTEYNDTPYQQVYKLYLFAKGEMEAYGFNQHEWIMFIHCREPKEIEKFESRLGAISLLVKRDAVDDAITSNHADAEVYNHNYHYTVLNNGTLGDLAQQAQQFLQFVRQL